jgi:4-hydroxybenzoate polyprenyltransferase
LRNLIPIIFYGNIFYGLCSVVLCLETNLQHHIPPNGPHFFLLVFAATVVYYTRIYFKSISATSTNKRTIWYSQNRKLIKAFLIVGILFIVVDSTYLLFKLREIVFSLHLIQWGLMVIFPLVAVLYTFKTHPFFRQHQLRRIGWLKPFFIGFAWSGLVTVYPVFFRQMQSGIFSDQFILPSGLFWLQNFLFISALAIMFDIKDHASDITFRLQTYPALLGIKKTIQVVIIPLAVLSLVVLLLYQWQQQAAFIQILIQLIPFTLLFIVSGRLNQPRGVLFYLVVIDGLMFIKGACGIISITLF